MAMVIVSMGLEMAPAGQSCCNLMHYIFVLSRSFYMSVLELK